MFNDFLPPVPEVHEKWEYLSFGYNDGVTVGDDLFWNGEGSYDFQRMWEYYVRHGEEKGEGYSSHILWGLRFEPNGIGGITDKEFWDDKKEFIKHPFLFISLLQFDKNTQTDVLKGEIGTYLEQELAERYKNIKAITYLTFDKSDLILVMQCKKYEDGASVINSLHYTKNPITLDGKKIRLIYSFTVASVKRSVLQENAVIEKIEGNIKHAYIFVIERYPGSIAGIYKKILDELDSHAGKESILGCNDEVIVIHDVPWNKFLNFFRFNIKTDSAVSIVQGTSVQSEYSASPEWSKNLIGITTMIGADVDPSNSKSCSEQDGSDKDDIDNNGTDKNDADKNSVNQDAGWGKNGEEEKSDQLLSATMREKCKKILCKLDCFVWKYQIFGKGISGSIFKCCGTQGLSKQWNCICKALSRQDRD